MNLKVIRDEKIYAIKESSKNNQQRQNYILKTGKKKYMSKIDFISAICSDTWKEDL